MQVLLIRHGHKAFSPADNPPLSDKGHLQAQKLLSLVSNKKLPPPTQCWYSPKLRTQQTLACVIEHYQAKEKTFSELDTRQFNENSTEMKTRVQNMIDQNLIFSKFNTNDVIFLCTHYDWIEIAMNLIPCDQDLTSFEFNSWAPSQYILFNLNENGIWSLTDKGVIF